ncbi:MAG: ABC-F family ATP-binding cassette domain-containing protein [Alphaproteobacteria bacterium]|nr:ABC-F family ATP-binding cassette domain-containing protein [Alphaproteobacteria bacterium]
MLTLRDVTVRLGGHLVLDHAGASIPTRARVGLVGRNGSGKSTMLKLIAGALHPDTGSVEGPRQTRIGYVAQDAPSGTATPFETVLAADTERARLLAEAEAAHDRHDIGEVHERLAAIGAHAAPARAASILHGMGFDAEMQARPLDSLSGGWRTRVALAAVLFSEPELLLLDEPSNHLDLEATLWLESFLGRYRGTLLLVSHERDLLNSVVDHILHLEAGKLTLYAGGYDEFARQRAERRADAEAQRTRQEQKRQKLQAFVDRWRYKAHSASQAQSRLKALAKLEPLASIIEEQDVEFHFPSPDTLRPPLLMVENAAVGYGGQPVLSRVTLRIDPDDRIALLGRNGNGKTTLARLLCNELPALAGSVTGSSKLRVGYFSQYQVDDLVPADTPIQHMARALPDAQPAVARAHLGRFGFSGEKAEVAVRHLSGGERARLALALITRDAPHMIILDEPTNHVDVEARDALVAALNQYSGAVLVVSHDRHLLQLVADRLILVADGAAKEFAGTLEDYRTLVLTQADSDETAPSKGAAKSNRKDERRAAAVMRERTQALRQAVKAAEADLAKLTRQRQEIEATLNDPAGARDGANRGALMKSHGELSRQVVAAEERWMTASLALEEAEAAPG